MNLQREPGPDTDGLASVDTGPKALADLATAIWRLQNKLADGPPLHHLRGVLDALDTLGVESCHYDGVPFDSGMQVRVLAFQPAGGLDREVVIETVRPAVYLHGALIQSGEVIVGTPEPGNREVQKGSPS